MTCAVSPRRRLAGATLVRGLRMGSVPDTLQRVCVRVVVAGLLHSAVIGPLKPGATYTYKVGDPSYGWSDKMTFTAPPLVGPVTNTRIIAFGGGYARVFACLELLAGS